MHEQRNPDRREVRITGVAITVLPQRIPRSRRDRRRRRSDCEQVENRVFAVSVPAGTKKTGLRFPPVRQQQRMAVQHPPKIDAPVDLVRQPRDFRVAGKTLPHREDARKQQRGVDRRDLAVPTSLPGLDIDPVIEPTALVKRPVGEEAQSISRALHRMRRFDPAPIDGDAER